MGSENLHESPDALSAHTRDAHRAIVSLMEELEAIDWYQQRAEACTDDSLRAVLLHNRGEEIEHAVMTLEWIRRHDGDFDRHLRELLFKDGPIEQHEEEGKAVEPEKSRTLGVGSLRSSR